MRTRNALIATAALLLFVGAGCGQKVAEKAAETAINDKLGDKGNVKMDDGTVTYKSDKGDTATYGENVKLPADFPKDVPVYPGGKIAVATVSAADGGATLSLTTSDGADKVIAWYKTQLSDWKQTASMSYGGSETSQYEKGAATITVIAAGGGGTTTVTVGRGKK